MAESAEKITEFLSHLADLEKRAALHRRVWWARYPSTVEYPWESQAPTGNLLHDLEKNLTRLVEISSDLEEIYSLTRAYTLPEGMGTTRANLELWREVQNLMGFDDSE
jgi:hypothetical protein